jgi:oxaloacetate decarboxylase (Na+ extruding) subunit gamma
MGELIQEGLKLMLVGMGIVYLFLMLLVWVINVSYRVISRFDPEIPPSHEQLSLQDRAHQEEAVAVEDIELVAVISSAIHRYRNQ